nr:hypothetical protein [Tanacetum cinerariifolium]
MVGTSQRVDTLDDTVMEDASNQGRMIDELDKDEGVVLMNEKEETKEVKDITGDAQVEVRQVEIYQIDMDHAAKVLIMQEDEPKMLLLLFLPDPEEESSIKTPTKTKSKDKRKGIMRYQVMKKRPQTEAQARKNMMMYLKNTIGFRLDYFKGMSYDNICPTFEAKFNSNIEFLLKSKEQIKEEENRAIASINETLAQKATKRRRLNEEAKDVKELKQHLEIVPDKDDDVYTEATLLARKVPNVDYQI